MRAALILWCIGAPLLIALGLWQLSRGYEKEALLQQLAARAEQPPEDIVGVLRQGVERADGRRVVVRGQALSHRWLLLDNRFRGGRVGYEWILPVRLHEPVIVLVNMGWSAAVSGRKIPSPPVQVPEQVVLRGTVYAFDPGLTLGEELVEAGWPKRVQVLDPVLLQPWFEEPLITFSVHVQADSHWPLQTGWQRVVLPPWRHWGYAVQWFVMALAWTLLSLWMGLRGARQSRAAE